MSWLSSLGSGIKNAAVGAGHAIGSVASNPFVEGAAGLFGGPLVGAAVGGLGRLIAPGGNLGNSLGSAAIGGGAGLVGNALGTSGKIGSFLANHMGGGAASAPEGAVSEGGGTGLLNGIENVAGQAGGFLKNAAGSALGAVTGQNGGGGTNPLLLALAAAQTANAAHLGQKADDYAQAATDQYANQAPLRSAGTSGLLTPRPMQSLSGLSAIRGKNPVAARSNPLQPRV